MLVRKFALVMKPASSPSNTRFVLSVKLGTSLIAETVSKKLLVVEAEPSFAINVILKLP